MITRQSIIFLVALFWGQDGDFLQGQSQYPRVREAISQKLENIKTMFEVKNISFPARQIFIRAFKDEQQLELWAQSATSDTFQYIKSYTFCSSSGILGPKRMQGDLQIPEGFYIVDRFNPTSNFHLSLGINYPNESDRILGEKNKWGGDIFIHGDCVTIGCIPITDEYIKELYVTAIYTKNNGQQRIPVHIFPFKMTQSRIQEMQSLYTKNVTFWNNLQEGYSYFEKHHRIPKISIDKITGRYSISD